MCPFTHLHTYLFTCTHVYNLNLVCVFACVCSCVCACVCVRVQDYVPVDGDLSYGPGETQKMVPVRLLELSEGDSLLGDPQQLKQFVMELSNPRQGAKLGRYPRTTVTITDQPGGNRES